MPVVIEELTAEITPETTDGGGEVQPAASAGAAATLELLALALEREERLAVD